MVFYVYTDMMQVLCQNSFGNGVLVEVQLNPTPCALRGVISTLCTLVLNISISIILKEIRQHDLQIGNGNAYCKFEFIRKIPGVDSIKCDLKISQETNPYNMTMEVVHPRVYPVKLDHKTSKFFEERTKSMDNTGNYQSGNCTLCQGGKPDQPA